MDPIQVTLWLLLVVTTLAGALALGVMIGRRPGNLERVMAQYEESLRHANAQNAKLVDHMIALCDPSAYIHLRRGGAMGVPPGSTQPVKLHAHGARNGDDHGPRIPPARVEAAVKSAVEAAMRDGADGVGMDPVRLASDVDRGSGLP